MPNTKVTFKDENGFHYKHPERSCKRCLNYPCIEGFDNLKGDCAKYGCIHYSDENVFNTWKR